MINRKLKLHTNLSSWYSGGINGIILSWGNVFSNDQLHLVFILMLSNFPETREK